MKPQQMSEGWWEPSLYDLHNRKPMAYRQSLYAMDDVTKSEVLLVGPRGEAILSREPRRIGFRPPR